MNHVTPGERVCGSTAGRVGAGAAGTLAPCGHKMAAAPPSPGG